MEQREWRIIELDGLKENIHFYMYNHYIDINFKIIYISVYDDKS